MMAREAVHNAVRHAHPSEVKVRLDFNERTIRMRVEDDGCGFDPDATLSSPGEHFGLVGMRERTERLGGRFRVRSEPGAGTELSIEVPVRA